MNRTGLTQCLVLGLFVSSLGCGSKNGATQEAGTSGNPAVSRFDPARGTAFIGGKVSFEGPVPAAAPLNLAADPACVDMHHEPLYPEDIVVRNARLQSVFVWVKEGLEKYSFETPAEPVTLTQSGCCYSPHVGGLMVNQKLRIVNGDSTLHNIHCMAENNPQFNIGQAVQGMSAERSFAAPEVMVRFKCDVHKWMNCYFGVVPHPYFCVTGNEGTYALKNLPAGDYVIGAWHEKLGTRTQKISLGDKETREVDFTFSASL